MDSAIRKIGKKIETKIHGKFSKKYQKFSKIEIIFLIKQKNFHENAKICKKKILLS
jgi:hypothetical protein